jgi:putative tricarboxylic transport membrane protein
MKNRDLLSSILWMALGALFVAGSLQQGLMRRGVPGPGFLPFFSGLALVFISLFVFIPALSRGIKVEAGNFFPERDSLKKLLLALAALVAFGVAMEYAGYLLTTLFFMFFTARIMKPKGSRMILVLAVLTAVLTYLLFVVLLEVQLPKGLLGF